VLAGRWRRSSGDKGDLTSERSFTKFITDLGLTKPTAMGAVRREGRITRCRDGLITKSEFNGNGEMPS
jgi:hypothetical protein